MTKRLPSYTVFGRRTLATRFSVLLSEINNVRTKNDIDAIHDMRVVSRRFHAAARIFSNCINAAVLSECEQYVRQLRKSAGAARDSDVQKLFVEELLKQSASQKFIPGLQRVIVRLRQKREKQYQNVLAALDEFERQKVAVKIRRVFTHRNRQRRAQVRLKIQAAHEISLRLSSFLSFSQYVHQSTASTELHQMRIEAKRLRYAMEIFDPIYRGKLKFYIHIVRSIQDSLGEMHDCDVWLTILPAFTEKERLRTIKYFGDFSNFLKIEKGILYLAERARKERSLHYHTFARIWKKCTVERTWERLFEIVNGSSNRKSLPE